ncbi:MAG: vanadium-dependent haloperoxidase [Natronosporangium sp.]
MRAVRDSDGSDDITPYPFESVPGAWQLTGAACDNPSGGPTGPVTPNWGRVTPFTMTSNTQFRQDHPASASGYQELLSSSLYATHVNEVKLLGRFDSATRTQEQTDIAWFWANDLDGTYKPVGQLLASLEDFTTGQGITDPVALSRIYTLVSLALADAGIAAWDQKYDTVIDLWRPQTAIQQADDDGNPATVPDPEWLPLLALAPPSTTRINPCFPAWVSGHATFAAAWAGVMANEFGDATSVTVGSEDPRAFGQTRTFSSFSAAAVENAESRIFLGVHYRFDADDGLATGFGLADHVYDNFLTELCTAICDEPASLAPGPAWLPPGGSIWAV